MILIALLQIVFPSLVLMVATKVVAPTAFALITVCKATTVFDT